MKIGIDCRMYGLEHAGIGRYVENLAGNLLVIDNKNEYVLFVRKSAKEKIDTEISRYENTGKDIKCKTVVAEVRHYSLKEQILMPYLIGREKVDLMHFPHFNVPVLYLGKYVVTIHDLIKHESRGIETTTRSPLFYWLKYLGYHFVFWMAVKRAKKIFVPSKTVALQLRKAYGGIEEKKIAVTYEGSNYKLQITNYTSRRDSPKGTLQITDVLKKYKIKKPFLLYVGSVYPHKNVNNLIKAIKIINKLRIANYGLASLVIVCARSIFWERLKREVKKLKAEKFVNLTEFVPDEELTILYQEAEAFVFPSLSEGFGLPGLEAMAAGLPVLASDIPVFREVYQDGVLYFDPKNPEDVAQKIKEFLTNEKLQSQLKKRGTELVKKYSWEKMANQTLKIYQEIAKIPKV